MTQKYFLSLKVLPIIITPGWDEKQNLDVKKVCVKSETSVLPYKYLVHTVGEHSVWHKTALAQIQ